MKETIKIGIGFVTGRPNVCKLINSTYKYLLEQINKLNEKVELTIFILFDLGYQYTTRVDFYGILPEVYKHINIKYITPEDIELMKEVLIGNNILDKNEANLFFGHGHAKGRNTLMYTAYKEDIDYLLFWDDDEYPLACIKDSNNNEILWRKQENIIMHYKNIREADVTIGHHCGYISPIPYVELNQDVNEDLFKEYIESISNEIVSWDSIKKKMIDDNGVTYADIDIANEQGKYEIGTVNKGKWVAGSTLCLNLRHIDKIPAFYNPEGARGEDTFFSINLINSKVIKVPVYHFHDGFLKYTCILKGNYPKKLRRIKIEDEEIARRFIQASRGWVKYKPLLTYILNKDTYKEKFRVNYDKLNKSIPEVNKLFECNDANILLKDFEKYSKNVKKDYADFLKTNEIWNKLKGNLKLG